LAVGGGARISAHIRAESDKTTGARVGRTRSSSTSRDLEAIAGLHQNLISLAVSAADSAVANSVESGGRATIAGGGSRTIDLSVGTSLARAGGLITEEAGGAAASTSGNTLRSGGTLLINDIAALVRGALVVLAWVDGAGGSSLDLEGQGSETQGSGRAVNRAIGDLVETTGLKLTSGIQTGTENATRGASATSTTGGAGGTGHGALSSILDA